MHISSNSMMMRIGLGKSIGFLFGLATAVSVSWNWSDAPSSFLWGLVLWYPTLGAFIGIFGVYDNHPVLQLPLPWWIRGPLIGAWGNLVASLLAYDQLLGFAHSFFGKGHLFSNPLWFAVDGLIFGMFVGYMATRYGGEGPATLAENQA